MESDNMECIFCKIVEGNIPSYTIYEDSILKVFLDVNPDSNGHMLIIPKKHILDLEEMDLETWNHLLEVAKDMKHLLEKALKIDGLTLIQNNGMVQEVKHFHLHLKPYYKESKPLLSVEEVYNTIKEHI